MSKRRFFNREISWLDFNARVLEEAEGDYHPLLERVKFLSIFHSNLDEFYMIRVSGLLEQIAAGVTEASRDGLTPAEQLSIIRKRVLELRARAWKCFAEQLQPALRNAGVHIASYDELTDEERASLEAYFLDQVYPVLTPLAADRAHPFPLISSLSVNLAVIVEGSDGPYRFARVKIPTNLPRLVRVAVGGEGSPNSGSRPVRLVWLEDVVGAHLDRLFRRMKVVKHYWFRVVRDADIEIRADEAEDLLQSIQNVLQQRRFGSVVQLEVDRSAPAFVMDLLVHNLQITPEDAYPVEGRLGLSSLMELMRLDRPDLKDRPYRPRLPARLSRDTDIFDAVKRRDILFHHPFESFQPIVGMLEQAATDASTLAIKQTIYRVGVDSPVVAALKEAGENGKQVSAIVELKARFDEENNLVWARALEAAGVHVVYSEPHFKVHCKLLMIVRREGSRTVRYVHLGTGNYNAKTAQLYTDFGLLTCDPVIADDVSALFNALTGYSEDLTFAKLLVSPGGIRSGLMARVDREIERARAGEPARLIFKMNSFTDFDCAERLYEASQAGVQIDLIVRGSCCVVPGVKGMSENISVRSIVGRFLEHDRVYYFRNGGEPEVWLGSADLMPRNLDRRYEVLFPIEDPVIRNWFIETYLETYLRDDRTARVLGPDGVYRRPAPAGSKGLSAQEWMMRHARLDNTGSRRPSRDAASGEQKRAPLRRVDCS